MSITKALDYLYYRISWWNTHVIKDTSFLPMSNVFGVSALQVLNLFTITGLILSFLFPGTKFPPNIIQIIIISTIILINYFYYVHRKRYTSILSKYSSYERSTLRKYDFILIMYIACTFISMVITIVIGRAYHAAPR